MAHIYTVLAESSISHMTVDPAIACPKGAVIRQTAMRQRAITVAGTQPIPVHNASLKPGLSALYYTGLPSMSTPRNAFFAPSTKFPRGGMIPRGRFIARVSCRFSDAPLMVARGRAAQALIGWAGRPAEETSLEPKQMIGQIDMLRLNSDAVGSLPRIGSGVAGFRHATVMTIRWPCMVLISLDLLLAASGNGA